MNKYMLWLPVALTAGFLTAPSARTQPKEVVFGMQCDRTGPTEIVGSTLCVGMHDYVDLINSKGGIEGYHVKLIDIDNQYKVPSAVEAFQREKEAGAITMAVYGTPQIVALAQQCQDSQISCTSPGFGIAGSADGKRYPYIFPLAASYWSQAAGATRRS